MLLRLRHVSRFVHVIEDITAPLVGDGSCDLWKCTGSIVATACTDELLGVGVFDGGHDGRQVASPEERLFGIFDTEPGGLQKK